MLKRIINRALIAPVIVYLCLVTAQTRQILAAEADDTTGTLGMAATNIMEAGAVFQGSAELLDSRHNPATLILYINSIFSDNTQLQEAMIEATVLMKTKLSRSVYGLKGFYASSCRQVYLYEISKLPNKLDHSQVDSMNYFFEPVGLAGQLSEDGKILNGQIAYNGNTKLTRVDVTVDLINELGKTISLTKY